MKKINFTNLLGAAAIAIGMSATSADANGKNPPGGGDEPSNPTTCSSDPSRCGGQGDTTNNNTNNNNNDNHNNNNNNNHNNNTNNNTSTSNSDSNSNSNSNSNANSTNNNNLSINNPRQVGNAPAAIAYANGDCKSGVGVSIGTFTFTGGVSFAKTDYKCMDYKAAQFLVDSGLRFNRGEIAILGLATFNNVSANIKMATEQVSEAYARCGKASMESNLVMGANAAMGGACPTVAPTVRRTYNMAAPRVERERTVAACETVVKEYAMCVGKFPQLTK